MNLQYTEKEKKGIDKVERMNRTFDRLILPGIGVIVILLLVSFIWGKISDKFLRHNADSAMSDSSVSADDAFRKRDILLDGYDKYSEVFEADGYSPAEGYSYKISLRKKVDDEMVIYQFADDLLGKLTIIIYKPGGNDAPYESLSLAVSSPTLLNVSVVSEGNQQSVTFTDTDFSSCISADEEKTDSLAALTSKDELSAMYEVFLADIDNLWSLV